MYNRECTSFTCFRLLHPNISSRVIFFRICSVLIFLFHIILTKTFYLQKLFLKLNTENLQSLRAGDTLIDLCLNLPAIKNAHTKISDALAGKPFSLPVNHADATTVRNR